MPSLLISAMVLLLVESAPSEDQVAAVLEDCAMCHDDSGDPADPAGLDLTRPLSVLVGEKSAANGEPFIVPGDPEASYLMAKLRGDADIAGDPMPLADDPLSAEDLAVVGAWIESLAPSKEGEGPEDADPDPDPEEADPHAGPRARALASPGRAPFHGTHQIVLPTTATLKKRTLMFRIDHRFGRIGTERGAFGLDAGVIMSLQLAYGILDGWDVLLRRTNALKAWELGSKYVALRQEDGMPVSLGAYASVEYLRDFDVANEWVGNVMVMVSRLWFDRWSTMLALGYHFDTNHAPRVQVDLGDGPELVTDTRDTMTVGFASTVWLGERKRWGVDLEYYLPILAGGTPDAFYYRGGDAGPDGLRQIGGWSIGGSLRAGLHFFQVFLTNNRQIHTNLWAPGGQSDNPFDTPGVSRGINKPNFFLGFNLARRFRL